MTYATYPSLLDKAILVTGGSSGIGASIVEHFCAQGARVAFIDKDVASARQLIERIASLGQPQPIFLEYDLRDVAQVHEACQRAEIELGPIGVIVNNAGNDDRHAIDDVTAAYWDERMAENLRHYFLITQALYHGMESAGGGAILNISSTTWVTGTGGMVAYSTAKAAIIGLTRSLARDLGPRGIRVNAIMPGWIMTERQIKMWLTPEGDAELMHRQCLKRKLYPADVARLALFLASDDSSGCTGHSYVIDAGKS